MIFLILHFSCKKQDSETFFKQDLQKNHQKDLTSSLPLQGLFVAERTAVDIQELKIFQAYVYFLKSGLAKLEWSMDDRSDFLSWQVCPKYSRESCQQGETASKELFISGLSFGSYTFSLRSCVRQSGQSLCGSIFLVDGSQSQIDHNKKSEVVAKFLKKQQEIKSISQYLSSVMVGFESGLKDCMIDEKDQKKKEIYDILWIQVSNINILGSDFIEQILSFDLHQKGLAESHSGQSDDSSDDIYSKDLSEGFSLTQEEIIQKIDPNLKAGSEFFPKDIIAPIEFSVWKNHMNDLSLSIQKKESLSKEQIGWTYLKSFFGIKNHPDYCYIFPKTLKSFEDVENRLKSLKEDLISLRKELQI